MEYPPSSLTNPSLGCPGMVIQNSRITMISSSSRMFMCISLTSDILMSEFLWSHHHFPIRNSIWVMFVHPAAPVALADEPAEQKSWAPAGWSLWPHIGSEIPGKPWAFCVSLCVSQGHPLHLGCAGLPLCREAPGHPSQESDVSCCTSLQHMLVLWKCQTHRPKGLYESIKMWTEGSLGTTRDT